MRRVEDFVPRTRVVNKEHHNWVPTEDIAAKLADDYSQLKFPWLEKEHIHGVQSIVTGVCEEHHQIVPMHVGNLWRGITKYGCPECAYALGHAFEGYEEFHIKRNRPGYIGRSKMEYNLFCAIKDVFPDALSGHRMVGGKEIDIWIPSAGCGIEYNGLYYHSDAMGKDERYHKEKSRVANRQQKGIFHLFPDEAHDVDRIVRLITLVKFGKMDGHNGYKVAPKSKLDVKVIMSSQAGEFHKLWNFIELKDSMLDTHVGVFSDGELIGVLSGNIASSAILKISFSKGFFEFAPLLKLINQLHGKPFAYVVDMRDPWAIGIIDPSVRNKGLAIGMATTPTAWPLDNRYAIIPRLLRRIDDLTDDNNGERFEGEVARTWDCGCIVTYSPKSKPIWVKPVKLKP